MQYVAWCLLTEADVIEWAVRAHKKGISGSHPELRGIRFLNDELGGAGVAGDRTISHGWCRSRTFNHGFGVQRTRWREFHMSKKCFPLFQGEGKLGQECCRAWWWLAATHFFLNTNAHRQWERNEGKSTLLWTGRLLARGEKITK